MSKYIDADLLIRKIRGQIRLENLNFAALGGGGQTFCINTLEWVLKQIDSLQQEQPKIDWEKELRNWMIKMDGKYALLLTDYVYELITDTAKHFYELGLNARMEE